MRFVLAPLLCWAFVAARSFAVDGSGQAEELFSTKVQPLLERACVKCHGAEKQKGELRLDSREAALKGGENGAALVPGKPEESLLLKLVRHAEAEERMPPKEKLTIAETAALEQWITLGAPWSEKKAAPAIAAAAGEKIGDAWSDPRNPIVRIFGGQRLELWSFKPIAQPALPVIRDRSWPRNALDHFTLARLESSSRSPAPGADRLALCRRVYFDLTGLPPSPEEITAFLADTSPDALERLVEKLLASPRYGEHWARMWLDVIRYSDSNGFDWDEFRPHAWRFRDYAIRSINADKPIDQFIREQLAGDEMLASHPRDEAEQERLIATGFLRLGPHDNSAVMFGENYKVRAQLMADLAETTGSAFLGLTLSCARCHDHKTDPISHADHFRLRAFFEGVNFADDLPLDLPPERDKIEQHNATIDVKLTAAREHRDAILTTAKERLQSSGKEKPSDDDAKKAFTAEEKESFAKVEKEVQALKEQKQPFTTGLLMVDAEGEPPPTRILYGGNPAEPREEVVPGFLSALDPNPAAIAKPTREKSTGRRTALADWIVSEQNPLTARVLVNRVWQSYFGEGIVATPNDFGFAGAPPADPQLLDWLAREFVQNGWSLKKLHRLIVTSATYRQRAEPRRLTAEQLRDSMLAVAGKLRETSGGPPIWPELPKEVLVANPAFLDDNKEKTKGWYPSPPEQQGVRSIFLVQKRTVRVPLMESFDLPENAVSCARRDVSTVAPQALTLLNSPFAVEMSRAFAERVEREAGADHAAQVDRAFLLALQRPPDAEERTSCAEFLQTRTLPELCRAILNLNEFIYLD